MDKQVGRIRVGELEGVCSPRDPMGGLSEEIETTIYLCWYSKEVHRTKCKALTIARLTHTLYTTKMARIRCYTMLGTIFKCQDIEQISS